LLPKYLGINKNQAKYIFFDAPSAKGFIFEIVKVLILPSWYPSQHSPFDGIFIQEQAEALARTGLDVTVLHADLKLSKLLTNSKMSSTLENGVKVIRKSGFAFPKANAYLLRKWAEKQIDLFEQYIEINGKPAVIHAHSFIAGHLGKLLKEISGAPLLLTEHHSDLLREQHNKRYRSFAKDCYDHCDQIIAVSSALQEAIKKISDTSVQVIPNLIDSSIFHPVDSEQRSTQQLKILGVGSFDDNKGFEHLIQSIPLLEKKNPSVSIQLDLIGEGPLHEKFSLLVASLNLEKKVHLHLPTNKKGLAEYYNKADVFCLPSQFETFGIVLIEALACGTPVVATSQAGPKDIVHVGNGKMAAFGQPSALADAIHEVYASSEKYIRTQLAKETIDRYGEQNVVDQILASYKRLIIARH